MRELATAIDLLADEDPAEIPQVLLTEQVLELHWQMARLQAQIARRTGLRHIDAQARARAEPSRAAHN
jgi:hypothetical protein